MMLSMYFAPLETVYVITRQLGYTHTALPQFASQLLFEVTTDAEGAEQVTVNYNKNPVKLGGDCQDQSTCSLNSFLSFTRSLQASASQMTGCKPADDFMVLGARTSSGHITSDLPKSFFIFIGVAALMAICIGSFLGYKAAQKENKKRVAQREADPESLRRILVQ